MLKDIKFPYDASFMEVVTVVSFITLGYLFLYRYGYYSNLGVSWYVVSISPVQIVASSFDLIISLIASLISCYIIFDFSNYFKQYKNIFINAFSVFLSFILLYLVLGFDNFFSNGKVIDRILLFINLDAYIFFIVCFTYAHQTTKKATDKILKKNIESKKIILVENKPESSEKLNNNDLVKYAYSLLIVVAVPFALGANQADRTIKYMDLTLSQASIKSSKDKWYILEINGDKVLVLRGGGDKITNTFKLIEYKEIEKIQAPSKTQMKAKNEDKLIKKIKGLLS